MAKKFRLEILTLVAVCIFCLLFLYTSSISGDAQFSGSDTAGSEKIAELAGVPADAIHPLIPQWVPPSAEIESGLFALQAAIGGIMVGLVFGYWIGQKKGTKSN
ncbi:MAG: cobalt transport protein CbiN [Methanomicrobiales archaeon]